jgi:hypothetical protein
MILQGRRNSGVMHPGGLGDFAKRDVPHHAPWSMMKPLPAGNRLVE